jgi:aminoglycoside 6-adenylyltransferase
MRNEQTMMDLILGKAKADERIRAVIMNGSRTNPQAPIDCFQDFDIVYIVNDIHSFTSNHSWVDYFGERIMMQLPDTNSLFPASNKDRFAYLMLFKDGNRLDLTLISVQSHNQLIKRESLSKILLDKDQIIAPFPSPSDRDYRVKKPSPKQFLDCCNEFWWVSTYVAKGLWRKEVTYAKAMLEGPVRHMLIMMLEWRVGTTTDFTVSVGKSGKYLENYLDASLWEKFMDTYPNGEYENIWNALFLMGDLFRTVALDVSSYFGYTYPSSDDAAVSSYLKHVYGLPSDATQIY